MTKKTSLSTESYKGVRDFLPEDMFIRNFMFKKIREVVESFGYEEYDASPLEAADLYRAKSGQEIVDEQTYTFTDRGGREVTLRPEMTPTLARLIAKSGSTLPTPVRWYSIPNLFRYEKPQKGRLREHYQLNVDMFGIDSVVADTEIISVADSILKAFGAPENSYVILLNSRKIVNTLYKKLNISEDKQYIVSKLIDKKNKISAVAFKEAIGEAVPEVAEDLLKALQDTRFLISLLGETSEPVKELVTLIESLSHIGITNVKFEPTLMRGFDYYTGIIFEVFDTDPQNPRAMFGGGRYDDLLSIFGVPKKPAIGFGMGDVTLHIFLENNNLLPEFTSSTTVYLCNAGVKPEEILKCAEVLRAAHISTAIDLAGKKISDQIRYAEKKHIPYIICIGENELASGTYELKHLSDGEKTSGNLQALITKLTS